MELVKLREQQTILEKYHLLELNKRTRDLSFVFDKLDPYLSDPNCPVIQNEEEEWYKNEAFLKLLENEFTDLSNIETFCFMLCLEIWRKVEQPKLHIKQEGKPKKGKKRQTPSRDLITLCKVQLVVAKSTNHEIPNGNYYYAVDDSRIISEKTCSSLAANQSKTRFVEEYMKGIEPSIKTVGCFSVGRTEAKQGERKMFALDPGLVVCFLLKFRP